MGFKIGDKVSYKGRGAVVVDVQKSVSGSIGRYGGHRKISRTVYLAKEENGDSFEFTHWMINRSVFKVV